MCAPATRSACPHRWRAHSKRVPTGSSSSPSGRIAPATACPLTIPGWPECETCAMATTREERDHGHAPRPAALDAQSLCEAFQITAQRRGDAVAVRTPDGSLELTYAQLRDEVERVARGLHRLGVRAGD